MMWYLGNELFEEGRGLGRWVNPETNHASWVTRSITVYQVQFGTSAYAIDEVLGRNVRML